MNLDGVVVVGNVLYFLDDSDDFEYFGDIVVFELLMLVDVVLMEDVGIDDKVVLFFVSELLFIGDDKV